MKVQDLSLWGTKSSDGSHIASLFSKRSLVPLIDYRSFVISNPECLKSLLKNSSKFVEGVFWSLALLKKKLLLLFLRIEGIDFTCCEELDWAPSLDYLRLSKVFISEPLLRKRDFVVWGLILEKLSFKFYEAFNY